MTTKNLTIIFLAAVVAAVNIAQLNASDAELLTDFFVPETVNASSLNGDYFTFTGLRGGVSIPDGKNFGIIKANIGTFPALTGLGVSSALLRYAAGGINPVHTHPRGTELLYVISGSLEVGVTDSSNKLYTQTIQAGDLFVFPKGLVHYQYNSDSQVEAVALSAFSSANPGLVSLPPNLFGAGIDEDILAKSFGVSVDVIEQLNVYLHTTTP